MNGNYSKHKRNKTLSLKHSFHLILYANYYFQTEASTNRIDDLELNILYSCFFYKNYVIFYKFFIVFLATLIVFLY